MELGAAGMLDESSMIEAVNVDEESDDLLPHDIRLPRFSHLPPATITGCR